MSTHTTKNLPTLIRSGASDRPGMLHVETVMALPARLDRLHAPRWLPPVDTHMHINKHTNRCMHEHLTGAGAAASPSAASPPIASSLSCSTSPMFAARSHQTPNHHTMKCGAIESPDGPLGCSRVAPRRLGFVRRVWWFAHAAESLAPVKANVD